MNKSDSKLKQLKALVLFTCVLSLSACAGKAVLTKDDSADYKSARSLPPLKKPSRVTYGTPPPVNESAPVAVESPVSNDNTLDSELENSVPSQENSFVPEPIDEPIVEQQVIEEQVEIAQAVDSSELQTQIISVNDNTKRLSIDAEAKQAWQFLVAKLSQSDLTVHARNEKAGRFSIGCSDVDTSKGIVKRGGWSIFTRKAEKQSDYCAMLVSSSREKTIVKVLDRSGLEANAESSQRIFERLL